MWRVIALFLSLALSMGLAAGPSQAQSQTPSKKEVLPWANAPAATAAPPSKKPAPGASAAKTPAAPTPKPEAGKTAPNTPTATAAKGKDEAAPRASSSQDSIENRPLRRLWQGLFPNWGEATGQTGG